MRSYSLYRTNRDDGHQPGTVIRDVDDRMVAYRSDKAYWIDERLAEVGPAAQVFIEETHLEESKRRGNNRGGHYFSIIGMDRQNKGVRVAIQHVLPFN